MKTNLFRLPLIIAAITFLSITNTNLYSQVTIGSDATPPDYSLLELDATATKGGMHIPRLTTVERSSVMNSAKPNKTEAKGLVIYNITLGKLEIWDGDSWLEFQGIPSNAPRITAQPRSFNWKETVTSARGENMEGIGGQKATLSITPVNADSVRWFEMPANPNSAPVMQTDQSATEVDFEPDLSQVGMKRYYCMVYGNGSLQSEIARVAVGCGALGNSGNWITFMCYNLGADPDLSIVQQMAHTPNPNTDSTTDSTVYGHFFQWGRIADGHQRRDAPTVKGGSDIKVYNYSVYREQIRPDSSYYGHFLTLDTEAENSGNWRPNTGLADIAWRADGYWNDPCPSGWVLPTSAHYKSIIDGYSSILKKENVISNSVVEFTTSTPGFGFMPDGVTTTLFLPHVGLRPLTSSTAFKSGLRGVYWTSESIGTQSYALEVRHDGGRCFDCLQMAPIRRVYGAAVRCVKF